MYTIKKHVGARLIVAVMVLYFGILRINSAAQTLHSEVTQPAQEASTRFSCGGDVEAQVWVEWDGNIRKYLAEELLEHRLFEQGDVYALYDFQTYSQNAVAMARRCKRESRLREIAQLLSGAYKSLSPGTFFSPGRRWVCRGGSICNEVNRLKNTEVMLTSVQFLALASSVANALATSSAKLESADKWFIEETTDIVVEHLERWQGGIELYNLKRMSQAKPKDVNSGSSELFFTDRHLWLLAIYAELSGILESSNRDRLELPRKRIISLRPHVSALLKLFRSRVSLKQVTDRRGIEVSVADIDRGFWRMHADNKYAGYEANEKPVSCGAADPDAPEHAKPQILLSPALIRHREDIGWDFSHARRLVHGLDALLRNRIAMQSVYSLPEREIPSNSLLLAFVNNLVAVVWNGDVDKPLFSNYWSGANGWYRVAYDNGTGDCREGYPPYGLSDSFLTGGYIVWAQYRSEIGVLGKRLYMLVSKKKSNLAFLEKYYNNMVSTESDTAFTLTRFCFLPSLVGVGIR